ncbi:MAG: exodeoxyribonuclease III [Alphaproteobacteria bacterium]|nr:MAG: exodeoxyribonuclease III [Alphaproteobacteria bacterium]
MLIATFNINGIRARLPRLLEWLGEKNPDIVCLQEIKCIDDAFPRLEIEDLGYNVETHGQKGFNGVALLSKSPLEDVVRGLPGDETDDQARYIEAFTAGVRIASLYLPNGNPAPGPKFDYKLAWMERLIAHARDLLRLEENLVLAGDYNICPRDIDVYDPAGWAEDALVRDEGRDKFFALCWLGLTDAVRIFQPDGPAYSFWDYKGGAWAKDHGLRIDHLLLSPQAADTLADAGIDRVVRGREKASDHVPVWCRLDVGGPA